MASASLPYWKRKDVCSKPSIMASERMSLNDLPDEILLEILSHFQPEDLCLIMAKVCKKWKVLAKDIILWKKLSYSCDEYTDISRIAEVLTAAPALHSLTIRDRKDVEHILEFLFHKHCDLRKLILEYCWLGEDGSGLLANIVDLFPDLEVLSLVLCHGLTSADYRLIARLKKLSDLKVSDYERGVSGEAVRLIADGCQHLKKLRLFGAGKICDDDVIHVINRLGKQLAILVLDRALLTDVVYSYLKNCVRLQKLAISFFSGMTDRGLLEGIGSLQELTSLHLNRGHHVTAQGWSTFFHQPSMTSIVFLNLWQCPSLDDEGVKGIAERCIHLKELRVGYCSKVTDAAISMVVSHCNQLHVLTLMGLNYVTGEGWLALVPSHLPHLRALNLSWCSIECDKYVEELVAAAPELIFINRWRKNVGAMDKRIVDYVLEKF